MKNQIADIRMLLTLKTVQNQLVRLINHFPGHGRTISSLDVIAPDYLDAFKGLYSSEFVELVGIAIQNQRFFPVIDDLKKIEIGQRPYNPYGGVGGFPWAEDVTQELTEAAKESQKMTDDNYRRINEFLGRIGQGKYLEEKTDKTKDKELTRTRKGG